MTKYKEYFERMITTEKQLFDGFTNLHMKYSLDQDGMQEQLNKDGARVLEVIREWEKKLCSTSEKAGYGGYTSNLSEKFWTEVRKTYPLIDHIGIIVNSKPAAGTEFVINKIKL